MTNLYNGWTPPVPESVRLTNELHSIAGFLASDPGNTYWLNRLDAVRARLAALGLLRMAEQASAGERAAVVQAA